MKTLLRLLLMASLLCGTAAAQEVKVESFLEDTLGNYAAQCPVKDINGACCALLKVQIIDKGLEFSSDWLIKTESHADNEYWVWLCGGTLEVVIKSDRIRDYTVRFGDYSTEITKLKGQHTYLLRLRVENEGEREPVSVKFSCNAPTAALYIDDIPVGKASSTVLVPSGHHTVKAVKEHYDTFEGTISLSPARYKKMAFYEIVMDTIIEDPAGQYAMGERYWAGRGVKQNEQKAIKWFTLSAENGYQEARDRLKKYNDYVSYKTALNSGNCDSCTADSLLYLAAEAGYSDAEYRYGKLFYDPYGNPIEVKKNPKGYGKTIIINKAEIAVKWFKLAAEHGNENAMAELGKYYDEAIVYIRNRQKVSISDENRLKELEEAIKWYQMAIDNGYNSYLGIKYAKEKYNKLKKDLRK